MNALRALGFVVSLLAVAYSPAQDLKGNPVAEEARLLGAKGFTSGKPTQPSTAAFKPSSSRPMLAAYAKAAGDSKAEQDSFLQAANATMEALEEVMRPYGAKHDAAAALAFTTLILLADKLDSFDPEKGFPVLIETFQKSLETPKVRAATDRQKQDFYEVCVGHATLAIMMSSGATDATKRDAAKRVSEQLLESLLGASPSQFNFSGNRLTLKPKAAPPVVATAGLAPGFTHGQPQGWTEDSGWLIAAAPKADSNDDRSLHAMMRFLPSIPASGNIGDALTKTWATALPTEMAGKAGGMVFRRYVGDGLAAYFICGVGREKTREFDTAFTLYMVDCKTHWQPIVLAQTYHNEFSSVGSGHSEKFTWPTTQKIADQMLATLRCPPAKGLPIATKESLVGDYTFGNGAAQNWVNVYTGATSTTFWSSGGSLKLAANGSFEWSLSVASGAVGATRFQGEKGRGTYTVQGDLLVLKFTWHDPSLSAPPKERRYRIAGVTKFSDGKRITVLLSDLMTVPSLSTMGPGLDWFLAEK